MGSLRAFSAASALLFAAAFTLAAPSATAASTAGHRAPAGGGFGYVALGDSYSSGLGSGGYLAESGTCWRSARSYPALWAAQHAASSFTFAACSGATITDVLGGQLGSLGESTKVVSLTVGGNDANFADVMATCVLFSETRCLQRVDQARSYNETALPGLLDKVYSAIRAKAPAAHVVVLGYPRFYRLDASCALGLDQNRRSAIDGAIDGLDAVIARRAAAHGFAFGDVRAAFAPHELCSTEHWWLHGVTYPARESYHPTADGQVSGYLPVFAALAGQ